MLVWALFLLCLYATLQKPVTGLRLFLHGKAINEKCCSVYGGWDICRLFSSQGKNKVMPGGQSGVRSGRWWNWLMHKLHLNTQTKRSVTTVVHTNIQENQISWRRINFITWKFGLYSTTNCRHKQRQPSGMNHLSYFCRKPKTIIPAENNNNRRKSVSNKELSQFRIK